MVFPALSMFNIAAAHGLSHLHKTNTFSGKISLWIVPKAMILYIKMFHQKFVQAIELVSTSARTFLGYTPRGVTNVAGAYA